MLRLVALFVGLRCLLLGGELGLSGLVLGRQMGVPSVVLGRPQAAHRV